MAKRLTQAFAMLGLLLTAGCAYLPDSGPSVSAIESQIAETPPTADSLGMSLVVVSTPNDVLRAAARPADPFDRDFGAPGNGASLVIGEGDIVSVTIWESISSGLTGGLFVSGGADSSVGAASVKLPDQIATADGIAVPFAGRVQVVGRSPLDVAQEIDRRLEGKAINPQAIVTFTKPTSNLVSVIGDGVANNAVPLAPGSDRITDVLARAGNFADKLDSIVVTLTRGGRAQRMPLARILADPRLNIRLSPGDLLTIEAQPNAFVAMGATNQTVRGEFGYKPFHLSDALAAAGGVIDARANPKGIYVMRLVDAGFAHDVLGLPTRPGEDEHAIAYQLPFDRTETLFLSRRFEVRDGDVIYVANAPYVATQRLLDLFRIGAASALSSQRLSQQ